jgi:glycosyltransferase involved in cell wall biosynthesis
MSALSGTLKDNVILIVCGPISDNYKSKLLQLVNDLKLQRSVIFYGPVTEEEEKAKLLCSADLFVFPTRIEVFGIVILEALAAGLPVLASNIGGIASFTNQFTAVYLLDPNNYSEWATHIQLVYNDREISNKARQLRKLMRGFKWSALAKKILDIYTMV